PSVAATTVSGFAGSLERTRAALTTPSGDRGARQASTSGVVAPAASWFGSADGAAQPHAGTTPSRSSVRSPAFFNSARTSTTGRSRAVTVGAPTSRRGGAPLPHAAANASRSKARQASQRGKRASVDRFQPRRRHGAAHERGMRDDAAMERQVARY